MRRLIVQMNVHRQRLTTLDKAALGDDDKTLAEVGVKEGDVVQIKDLGPQICQFSTSLMVCLLLTDLDLHALAAWRTVVCNPECPSGQPSHPRASH
jgi:hypothetical protein